MLKTIPHLGKISFIAFASSCFSGKFLLSSSSFRNNQPYPNSYQPRGIQYDSSIDLDAVPANNSLTSLEGKLPFNSLLVAANDGKIFALSGSCGYDMSPLKEGILHHNRIICTNCYSEWNIETGEALSGPNHRDLATFPVILSADKVQIKVPKGEIPLFKNPFVSSLKEHVVIVGDSYYSAGALAALKKSPWYKISLIHGNSRFKRPLLDFNKLSSDLEKPLLENIILADFTDVNLIKDQVDIIDVDQKLISTVGGRLIEFDKVFVNDVNFEYLPKHFENVFFFRDILDHAELKKLRKANRITVLGETFTALRLAVALRNHTDCEIKIVFPKEINIFKKILGKTSFLKLINALSNLKIKLILDDFEMKDENGRLELYKGEVKQKESELIFCSPKSKEREKIKINVSGESTEIDPLETTGEQKDGSLFLLGDFLKEVNSNPKLFNGLKGQFDLGMLVGDRMSGVRRQMSLVEIIKVELGKTTVVFVGNLEENYDSLLEYVEGEKVITYLFKQEQLVGATLVNCRKLPFYFKEALEQGKVPSYKTIVANVAIAHKRIQFGIASKV